MGVQLLTVGPDEAEQRLDRWFRRQFPHISQGRLEKLCRNGEVRVDGGRVKTATRITPGQVVRVPPLPEASEVDAAPAKPAKPAVDPGMAAALQAAVVFRDDHILVLNKPAGLATQGGTGQVTHLAGLLGALRFGREDEPRLIHRLDKDTSGLIVLARTGSAAVALARAFKGRSVEKIYFALVAGRPNPAQGTIRYGLVKAGGAAEKMQIVHPNDLDSTPDARPAITDYRVIDQAGNRAAWVAARPITGRTHQIRAHLAALGCPVAGDGKYGGRGQENDGSGWGAGLGGAISRKLHLHAAQLRLPHPITGRQMTFVAPLPEHMARSWDLMGWSMADLPDPIFPPQ